MNNRFIEKNVVVTAGGSGIGLNVAKNFANEGAQVYVCDIDKDAIMTLHKTHPGISGFKADISNYNEVVDFFNFVKSKTKVIDILINNAGIAGPTEQIENILVEDWDKTIAVNLNGMFYSTKFVIPCMKINSTGSIINISSSAAFSGYPYRSPYTASKWAVIGLTKTMAMELGPFNIRVNAICPGSVDGSRINRVIEKEADKRNVPPSKIRKDYESHVSLKSFVKAEDITNTILFLCSDEGKMISGQVIGVDGHTETLRNFE